MGTKIMRTQKNFILYPDRQGQMESEFMTIPNAFLSTSYGVGLQTYESNPPIADDRTWSSLSDANLYLSWMDDAHRQLKEVRHEAEEAYALDDEIDRVPESAYNEVLFLLEILFHSGIPTPDISWAEDGSLSLGWYPGEGIVTMGIYGDNLVIYTAFFEEKRQIEGICELSDIQMLSGFLATLLNILS